jgi:cycloeucalenol cycloisomerase
MAPGTFAQSTSAQSTSAASLSVTPAEGRRGGHWFSTNPDKAWGEKFFLAYLPYFFALNYSKQLMGWMNVGTFWHVTQNLALLLPLIVIPAVLRPAVTGRAWWDNYAVKMVLWMFAYNFVVTYFGCEYFFDVLGMVYYFPQVSVSLDSALVGSGEQVIPIGMYFNAPAFFVVYHTIAVLLMRRVRTIEVGALKPVLTVVTVVAVAYLMAFLETRLVATDANKPYFWYQDLGWMLKYGSIFYACYFLPSFPMVFRLEEQAGDRWALSRVVFEALAAAAMVLVLIDFATHFMRQA